MLSKLISTEIPKWALPKESISLYVKIHRIEDIKQINIKLPENFIIKDLINISEHTSSTNQITVTKIGKLKNGQNYFGIILSSTKYFSKLATSNRIVITVMTNSDVEEIFYEYVRIFRPRLEVDIDEQLSLTNKQTKIPIHIKFIGFGDVSLRIEAEIGGKIVTKGGYSLFDMFFNEILANGVLDKSFGLDSISDKKSMIEYFNIFKSKLRDPKYVDDILNSTNFSKNDIESLKNISDENKTTFMDTLYGTLEFYIIKKLTDILVKSIKSNIRVDSGTEIETKLYEYFTDLKFTIYYQDLLGNTYEPIIKLIQLRDCRKKSQKLSIMTPILIDVDNDNFYQNVEDMKIND